MTFKAGDLLVIELDAQGADALNAIRSTRFHVDQVRDRIEASTPPENAPVRNSPIAV